MKYIVSTIAVIFIAINALNGQSAFLVEKAWKVAGISTVFKNKKNTTYNKDSITNTIDYSNIQFSFNTNGTYAAENTKDNSSKVGIWSIKNTFDSAQIDSVNFLIVKLSSDSFITRGYSLQLVDTSGNIDTVYNYLKLYKVNAAALHAELTSFAGENVQNKIRLTWSTQQEYKLKYFAIERSKDSLLFDSVGVVKAKGISMAPSSYSFTDSTLIKSKLFYRLKLVDSTGTISYSGVLAFQNTVTAIVDPLNNGFEIKMYPNPANHTLNIAVKGQINGRLQLQITNLTGQAFFNKSISGVNNNTVILLPIIPQGLYVVEIRNKDGIRIFSGKLIIQK